MCPPWCLCQVSQGCSDGELVTFLISKRFQPNKMWMSVPKIGMKRGLKLSDYCTVVGNRDWTRPTSGITKTSPRDAGMMFRIFLFRWITLIQPEDRYTTTGWFQLISDDLVIASSADFVWETNRILWKSHGGIQVSSHCVLFHIYIIC